MLIKARTIRSSEGWSFNLDSGELFIASGKPLSRRDMVARWLRYARHWLANRIRP